MTTIDERLAEIRERLEAARRGRPGDIIAFAADAEDDIAWLVKQVEKIRQLRDMIARESCCHD